MSFDLYVNIFFFEIPLKSVAFYYPKRYGWHGNDELLQKSFDVAAIKYPWVNNYRDRAVTELEYLHGHLNDPGSRAACFFFRDKVTVFVLSICGSFFLNEVCCVL